jgi:hypothetical protein
MIRILAVLAVVCGSLAPAYAAPAGIEVAERRERPERQEQSERRKAERAEQRQEQTDRRAEPEQQQDDDSGTWQSRRNDGWRGETLRIPVIAPRMSPDQAAGIARAQNDGGRVLQVQPTGEGYRVKLLKDGEVRVVEVPGP